MIVEQVGQYLHANHATIIGITITNQSLWVVPRWRTNKGKIARTPRVSNACPRLLNNKIVPNISTIQ